MKKKKTVLFTAVVMAVAMLAAVLCACGGSTKADNTAISIKDSGWTTEKEDDSVVCKTELSSSSEGLYVLYYPTSDINDHGYSKFLFRPEGTKMSIPESELRNGTFSVIGGYRQDPDEIEEYGITFDPVQSEIEAYPAANYYTVTQTIHSESLPQYSMCLVNIHAGNGTDNVEEVVIDENGDGQLITNFTDTSDDMIFETEYIRAILPDQKAASEGLSVSWGEDIKVESVLKDFYEYSIEALLNKEVSGFGIVNIGSRPIRSKVTFLDGMGTVSGAGLGGADVVLDSFTPFEVTGNYQHQF